MKFFVVTIKVYTPERPAEWRLFRSNVPAVEYAERWVHYVVPCADPTALVRAKPDRVSVGGLDMRVRADGWRWHEEDYWELRGYDETESRAARLGLDKWEQGRFRGPQVLDYRRSA